MDLCPECRKTIAGCESCERRASWDVTADQLGEIKRKLTVVANDAAYIPSYEYREYLRWAVEEIETLRGRLNPPFEDLDMTGADDGFS